MIKETLGRLRTWWQVEREWTALKKSIRAEIKQRGELLAREQGRATQPRNPYQWKDARRG